MERIQKYLQKSNLGSRRKIEQYIIDGKIKVNGELAVLGMKVSKKDKITYLDEKIIINDDKYILINKGQNVLSIFNEHPERQTLKSLLKEGDEKFHLVPIDKLNYVDQGLIVASNDNEFNKILLEPSLIKERAYIIRVDGIVIKDKVRQIRNGIKINSRTKKPLFITIIELDKQKKTTLIKVALSKMTEKELEQVFADFGHKIMKKTRINYLFFEIEGIQKNSYRDLTVHEIKRIYALKK